MTTPTTPEHSSALAAIREAEAARMIGVLDVQALPAQAAGWVRAGIDETPAYSLAALDDTRDPTGEVRTDLLATLAVDTGQTVATLAEARVVHADTVIRTMVTGGDFGRAIFDFSNSYTDRFTNWLRRRVSFARVPNRPMPQPGAPRNAPRDTPKGET